MAMKTGTEKLALAALVVALLLVPITLYTAMNLGDIVEQQQKSTENINKQISSISQQLNQSNQLTSQVLQQLQQKLQNLENNITILQNQVTNLTSQSETLRNALASNITSLSEQLASLQAQISLLSQGLSMTNQTLRQSLAALNNTIASIQEQLQQLQESASLLFPVTITDGTGDQVVIPKRPTRIVSIAPSVSEMLYFVNATDRIVGVDQYTDWPPELVNKIENGSVAIIGGFWNPDVERILSLDPDLVVGVANVPSHQQVKEILSAYGIPVILLPQGSVADIKSGLIMLGQATGNIADATRAAADFESKVLRISLAGSNVEEKRSVAIIVWLGNPIYVVGNGTFQGSGIQLIGAYNAFGNLTGWPAISPEELLGAVPDVIILTGINLSDFYSFVNETLGNASQSIPAIANNRVYTLASNVSNLLNRPSPRFAQGLLLLQFIVYPEIYGYNVTDVPHIIEKVPSLEYPSP